MSRKERLYISGLPQIIQLKGHNHDSIFNDQEDYQRLLKCLDKALNLYCCALHAYTLLPQQILLLLTPQSKEDLSRFIQHIGRSYVPYYNHKYHRSGALWEGRYNSCLIEPGAYLLLAQQFIDTYSHPFRIDSPELPDWSSYRCNIGEEQMERITPHLQYQQLGKSTPERAMQYRRFIHASISPAIQERIHSCLSQNCVLGTAKYCQQLEAMLYRRVRPRHCGRPRKYYHNQVTHWVWLENLASRLLQRYCYQEIRLPLLERWEEQIELNQQEERTAHLSCNHSALLRGEGTMGCLRVVAQHQQLQSTSKLWYLGAMFRTAYRQEQHIEQYHQLGVEAFGYPNIDIELEHLFLQYDFFKLLRLKKQVELKINTLGSSEEFSGFREALRDFYQPFGHLLASPWPQLLQHAPERLLLSSDPLLKALQANAPKRADFLSDASRLRFEALTESLGRAGIPFVVDNALYPKNAYCHTVFEWRSDKLEESDLLCRGGRYDDSASRLLDKPVSACGFAFMLDPLMRLLQLTNKSMFKQQVTDVVIIPRTPIANESALSIGRALRVKFPQLSIANDCSNMRINACIRNAERLGGRFIVIVPPRQTDEVEILDKENDLRQEVSFNTMLTILSNSINS